MDDPLLFVVISRLWLVVNQILAASLTPCLFRVPGETRYERLRNSSSAPHFHYSDNQSLQLCDKSRKEDKKLPVAMKKSLTDMGSLNRNGSDSGIDETLGCHKDDSCQGHEVIFTVGADIDEDLDSSDSSWFRDSNSNSLLRDRGLLKDFSHEEEQFSIKKSTLLSKFDSSRGAMSSTKWKPTDKFSTETLTSLWSDSDFSIVFENSGSMVQATRSTTKTQHF